MKLTFLQGAHKTVVFANVFIMCNSCQFYRSPPHLSTKSNEELKQKGHIMGKNIQREFLLTSL